MDVFYQMGQLVMLSQLTILLVTFARPQMIRKTVYALLKNTDCLVKFHLADNDTSGRTGENSYIQDIMKEFHYLEWTYTVEENIGWGNNVNTALKAIQTDYIFLIEDDRAAYNYINLQQGIRLLENKSDVGLVRYDGIAGHTGTILRLDEVKIPGCRFSYCTIDQKRSKRPITYSNQPHLRHRRFTEYYGLYPEDVKLGLTERMYAVHVKRNPDGPKIAILEDGIQNRFQHLGAGKNSRQHGKWDK